MSLEAWIGIGSLILTAFVSWVTLAIKSAQVQTRIDLAVHTEKDEGRFAMIGQKLERLGEYEDQKMEKLRSIDRKLDGLNGI